MAGRAVIGLMAGSAAVSTERCLAPMTVVTPAQHMVPRAHDFVALEAVVARTSAQVLVAVLAVCVLVPGLLSMIGAKLDAMVFWQCATCEVSARRIAVDHALMANLASRYAYPLRCAGRILMTLGALLHLRDADVFHIA